MMRRIRPGGAARTWRQSRRSLSLPPEAEDPK